MNTFEACKRSLKRLADKDALIEYAKLGKEEVQVKIGCIDTYWVKFGCLHDAMLARTDPDFETLDRDMEDTERRVCRATAAPKKRLAELTKTESEKPAQQLNVSLSTRMQKSAVKNTWGEFNGDLLKWLSFKDRFRSAVHNNEQIEPAYKFAYLRKSLIGEASKEIGEWQLTGDNYSEAWERLLQRYDKMYQICRAHLRTLLSIPVLRGQPTAEGLQRMRQLRALGVPVEHWHMMVVHIIHERLYEDTARQWELTCPALIRQCGEPKYAR